MRTIAFAFSVAAFCMPAAMLVPTAAMAGMKTLDGTVTYRERIALPPGAEVEVRLVDVSLADAPARTIAETTIAPEGQVPVPYALEYESAEIVPGRTYALQARITADGRLLFVTKTHHAVFSGGADATEIVVERAADTAASPAGSWLLEGIGGGTAAEGVETVLEIAGDGRVSGRGGCNGMGGMATIAGEAITFGPIVATNMACAPAAMEQEARFLAALAEVRAWRIDPAQQKLTLLDAGGNTVLVLARRAG